MILEYYEIDDHECNNELCNCSDITCKEQQQSAYEVGCAFTYHEVVRCSTVVLIDKTFVIICMVIFVGFVIVVNVNIIIIFIIFS